MTAADQTVQREKSACHEAVHICLTGADAGHVEGRAVARNALCDTPSGKGRGDRAASVLQSPEASLDAGISQLDGLREKKGLPIKKGTPHNRSAKEDAKCGQVHCLGREVFDAGCAFGALVACYFASRGVPMALRGADGDPCEAVASNLAA